MSFVGIDSSLLTRLRLVRLKQREPRTETTMKGIPMPIPTPRPILVDGGRPSELLCVWVAVLDELDVPDVLDNVAFGPGVVNGGRLGAEGKGLTMELLMGT